MVEGPSWWRPPECCIVGADGQPSRCRSAWLLAFRWISGDVGRRGARFVEEEQR